MKATKTYAIGDTIIDQYGNTVKICNDEIEAKDYNARLNHLDAIDGCDEQYETDSFGYNYSDWN